MSDYRALALAAIFVAVVDGVFVFTAWLFTGGSLGYDGAQTLLLFSIALGVLAMGEERRPDA